MSGPTGGREFGGPLLSRRIIRLTTQLGFVIAAGILLVVAGYRLTALWLVPEVAVAIPSADTEFVALFQSLARKSDRTLLEIQVKAMPDAAAVDAALAEKSVEFAVVRPDIAFPANAMVAALLKESNVILLAPEAAKVTRADQLAGKRIGVIGMDEGDKATFKRVLDFHQASDAVLSDLSAADAKAAVSGKRVDVIAATGGPTQLRQLVRELAALKPVIVPLGSAELTQLQPGIASEAIAAKSLPGGLPEEEVQTISTSYLLVAGRDVDRTTVNAFLQMLFSRRPALAREHAIAWQIKPPADDSNAAKFPNHRGALDYYNREQQTFMDLYGDWIWLALFAAGGFSSAGAWLTQTLSRRRKQLVENILDRLLEILGEAREAQDVKTLEQLTLEIDGLVTHAIRQARWRASELTTTSALTLAIDSSRAAIADRRRALLAAEGESREGQDREAANAMLRGAA